MTDFFNSTDTMKKLTSTGLIAAGASLAAVDAFRLANGDASVLGGGSFSMAFATHAGLFAAGLGLTQTHRQATPALILVQDKN